MVGDGFAVAALCALMPLSGSQAATGHAERKVTAALAGDAQARSGQAGHAGASSALASSTRVASARAGHVRAGQAPVRRKAVRYRGYTFLVPRSWPVVDDRTQSHGCVRFDQHAVYLGAVRGDEFCPSWLLGTTESILIQPGPARSGRRSSENPVAREITARAPRIAITATFGTDPTVIYRILASASLPSPVIAAQSPAQAVAAGHLDGAAARAASANGAAPGSPGRPRLPRMRQPMPPPPLPTSVASYRGLGFDACTAPSRRAMRAWRLRSPYRAIGIYIGGADRACAQPNLSQAWVRAEASAGWRFIPLYAGPQAAFGELHAPVRQGLAAARDAVAQARRLGFGRRTPIYYDMEAYHPGVRIAALRFLSAWTIELHRLRYSSGVYSSSDSGIADLSRQYAQRIFAMPNVIYDALWNGAAGTSDRNLRTGQWHLRRIHQFSGNVTQRYGGHAINIDKDFLDVRMRALFATPQATSAVTLPDGSVDLFYLGRGSQLWFDRYSARGGWATPVPTGATASSVPSVVSAGPGVDVFYTTDRRDSLGGLLPAGRQAVRPARAVDDGQARLGSAGGGPAGRRDRRLLARIGRRPPVARSVRAGFRLVRAAGPRRRSGIRSGPGRVVAGHHDRAVERARRKPVERLAGSARPLVGAAQPWHGPARRAAAGDSAAERRHPGVLARLRQLVRLGGLLPAGDGLAGAT